LTRPRLEINDEGLLLILRGVNLNEQADPSDMISLPIWVDEHRLISIERERFRSRSPRSPTACRITMGRDRRGRCWC